MLSISLMYEFWQTVDQSKQRSPVVDEIAAKWLTGQAAIQSLRASVNITCFVQSQEKEQIILRLNPVGDRPIAQTKSELEIIRQLWHKGIRTARVIPSLNGNEVECVSTQLGEFHVVAFSILYGEHFKFEALRFDDFRAWGMALAEFHTASEGIQLENRPSWVEHLKFAKRWIPHYEQALLSDLTWIEDRLNQLPVNRSVYGLIHYDFELDNILWNDGQPSIIDFDDSGYYWLVADIAIALRELFDNRIEQINFRGKRFQAFLEGYRSRREIDTTMLRNMPLFLRIHNLVTYARIQRACVEKTPNESEWEKGLRQELQERLKKYRAGVERYPIEKFYKTFSANTNSKSHPWDNAL